MQHSIQSVDSTTQEAVALVVFSILCNAMLLAWGCCPCGGKYSRHSQKGASTNPRKDAAMDGQSAGTQEQGSGNDACDASTAISSAADEKDSQRDEEQVLSEITRADALMMQFLYSVRAAPERE